MSQYLAQLKKLENGGEGTLKNLKNPPAIGSLGFLGTPTPLFSKNEGDAQNTKSGQPAGTVPLVPDSGSLGSLGFLGTPTPLFSKNEGDAQNTKSGQPAGTVPLVPDSGSLGSLGSLGFLGTPTPLFSKNEGDAQNTKSGQPAGTVPLVPDSGSLGSLGFLGTPTPLFSKNERGADCYHEWLVTHPNGERATHCFAPAKSREEVLGLYADALVEPVAEPEPLPLPPDALPLVYAYLNRVGETCPVTRTEFVTALERDHRRLAWLYGEVGLAEVAAV